MVLFVIGGLLGLVSAESGWLRRGVGLVILKSSIWTFVVSVVFAFLSNFMLPPFFAGLIGYSALFCCGFVFMSVMVPD